MLGLSAVWAVLFVAALYPDTTFSYVATQRKGLSSVLLATSQINWLLPILLAVVILRFGRFMFSDGEIDPLWDSLAIGAVAYCFCILTLRMFSGYYMAPANLIALVYLARVAKAWLSKPTRLRVSIVAIALGCLLLHDAAYSSFLVIERKGMISTKSQLAKFLKSYVSTKKGDVIELYFPYAEGPPVMELSAYLRWKGFQLAGQSVRGPEAGPVLVVEGRADFSYNRCVEYANYTCIHADSAKAGALIVVMPDDDVPISGVDDIRRHAVSLLSVGGCGTWSRLVPWLRLLRTIHPQFWQHKLPEHWLRLDVLQETTGS
jgi:hypothetical protein